MGIVHPFGVDCRLVQLVGLSLCMHGHVWFRCVAECAVVHCCSRQAAEISVLLVCSVVLQLLLRVCVYYDAPTSAVLLGRAQLTGQGLLTTWCVY